MFAEEHIICVLAEMIENVREYLFEPSVCEVVNDDVVVVVVVLSH